MKKREFKIFVLVFLISILFIIIGIKRDEFSDIKNKSIRICLECIGIG